MIYHIEIDLNFSVIQMVLTMYPGLFNRSAAFIESQMSAAHSSGLSRCSVSATVEYLRAARIGRDDLAALSGGIQHEANETLHGRAGADP